jgi:hypothetical protein
LSVSAIIETVLAVLAYWWIAVHFETYLPLLMSAAIAPLVLLRSDQSVSLGLRWFAAWETRIWSDHQSYNQLVPKERWRVKALVVSAAFLAGMTTYLLAQKFLGHNEGWSAFGYGFVIGWAAATLGAAVAVMVAGVVTGPVPGAEPGALAMAGPGAMVAALATGILALVNAKAGVVAIVAMLAVAAQIALTIAIPVRSTGRAIRILLWFSPLVVPGVTLGVFVVSLIVRLGATMRYILLGLRNLPRNFRRLVLCTSPLQTPELVPDLRPGGTSIALEHLWLRFQAERRSNDVVKRMVAYIFYPLTTPFWFFTGWLYRVTLKSTA